MHQQEAGWEVKHPGPEPALVWDAGMTGSGTRLRSMCVGWSASSDSWAVCVLGAMAE